MFVEASTLFRKKASYLKLSRTKLTKGVSVIPLVSRIGLSEDEGAVSLYARVDFSYTPE